MDKKLYELDSNLQEKLKDLTTLNDASLLLDDGDVKSGIKAQMIEDVLNISLEDLNKMADVMQQIRKSGANGQPKYSDLEVQKYFALDVLFMLQEQIDALEAEKLEERKEILKELSDMDEKEKDENESEFALLNPVKMPYDLVDDEDIMNLSDNYFTTLKNIMDGSSATLFRGKDEVLK